MMRCPHDNRLCHCDINSALTCPSNKALKAEPKSKEDLTKGDIKRTVNLQDGVTYTDMSRGEVK